MWQRCDEKAKRAAFVNITYVYSCMTLNIFVYIKINYVHKRGTQERKRHKSGLYYAVVVEQAS